MNNIVLVGFMAVGKTTVGKSLKKILGFELFDVDKIVENEEKITIADIFKTKGEGYFRQKEKEIAKRLLSGNNNIISTGGGLFLDEEIRTLALKDNFVVFLELGIDEIHRRVNRSDKRPLAKSKSLEELRLLYEKRLPFYKQATVRIITDKKNSSQVAKEIVAAYYKWLIKEL